MSQKLERFHKYLNLYQKLIKVNAGKFVGDQLAEDVTQETLLRMYKRLDYLDDETVKQWLIVVSGNIAKDFLKKGGNYEVNFMNEEEFVLELEEYSESAEMTVEKQEKQKAARDLCRTACNLLYEKNPDWYEVIVDSCLLGMSSAQIAKLLNTTTQNVDVMKFRAREYLRKKLGNDYADLI